MSVRECVTKATIAASISMMPNRSHPIGQDINRNHGRFFRKAVSKHSVIIYTSNKGKVRLLEGST